MFQVTRSYAQQIKRVPFRNRTYMKVYFGVYDKKAQKSLKVVDNSDYLYISNKNKLFEDNDVTDRYATFEGNYFRVDGSMNYAPKEKDVDNYILYNNGVISKSTTTFSMDNYYDLPGLTIDFGCQTPYNFNIVINKDEEDENVIEVLGNTNSYYQYKMQILHCKTITIVPIDYKDNTNGMLHIEYFVCGLIIIFNNKEIESASLSQSVHPVSAELSSTTFNLVGFNINRSYDIEKDSNISHYFQVGQPVEVNYGLLLQGGKIEWVNSCELELSEWSITDTRITIDAVDTLGLLDGKYIKGTYSSEGKTLYELAVEVFEDAGIEEYNIDYVLQNYITHNPLPILPYKELLQLIANAGKCTLIQSRNKQFEILPTEFVKEEETSITTTTNGEALWSNAQTIVDQDITKDMIGDWSQGFMPVDGSFVYESSENVGYISESVSNENGYFRINPKLTFEFEVSKQVTDIMIDFGTAHPQSLHIKTYYGGVEAESIEFSVDNSFFDAAHNFGRVDKIEITITQNSPNSRVHIKDVYLKPIDFLFDYTHDLKESPKASIITPVKTVSLLSTELTKSDEIGQVYSENLEIVESTDYSAYEIDFSSPCELTSLMVGEIDITEKIIQKGSYAIIVDLADCAIVGETLNIIANGYVLKSKTKTYKNALNVKGRNETYTNLLIDNEAHAREVLDWVGNYEQINKEYELIHRGYPELDCNDVVYLEIPTLHKNIPVRIINQTIDFNGGSLSGKTIAVREVAD